jgi:hypothetical protein
VAAAIAVLLGCVAQARPIVYPHSTTVMAEHAGGELGFNELQVFYAPRYFLSWGAGHLEFDADGQQGEHRITYARLNLLAQRWNMESAQANFFVWGGAGQAHFTEWVPETAPPGGGDDEHDHEPPPPNIPAYQRTLRDSVWNAGAQVDFETRRIYTSFRSDAHFSSSFLHRSDMLMLGFAPYEHDMDTWATWIMVSGRRHSGDMHDGSEVGLLLRFFKKRTWLEAGVTLDGNLQARAMFSL